MFYSDERIVELLGGDVVRARRLQSREMFDVLQAWRRCFSARLHAATGAWILESHDWHVFSMNYFPHRKREEARQDYLSVNASHVFVRFETDTVFEVECRRTLEPAGDRYAHDWYIWPLDLAWTYVLTHEEQFGPYFARAEAQEAHEA